MEYFKNSFLVWKFEEKKKGVRHLVGGIGNSKRKQRRFHINGETHWYRALRKYRRSSKKEN